MASTPPPATLESAYNTIGREDLRDAAEIQALITQHWPKDTLTLVNASEVKPTWTCIHFPNEWTRVIPYGCRIACEPTFMVGVYSAEICHEIAATLAGRVRTMALGHQGHPFEVKTVGITTKTPVTDAEDAKINELYRVTVKVSIDPHTFIYKSEVMLWFLPSK
jgi:hypothetical protein